MYQMICRYETYGNNIEDIVNFIDWLSRFKEIELTHANGATVNDIETLAMQFHGIDKKQLEMERRALIAANKAVTG